MFTCIINAHDIFHTSIGQIHVHVCAKQWVCKAWPLPLLKAGFTQLVCACDVTGTPCQLYCRPKDQFFSVMLKDLVADGTPCPLRGKNAMCINGLCRVSLVATLPPPTPTNSDSSFAATSCFDTCISQSIYDDLSTSVSVVSSRQLWHIVGL